MIHTIRKTIAGLLYYSGITNLVNQLGSHKTTILIYHRVFNLNSDFDLDPGVVSTSVDNFEKQMEYLSKKYNVISLEEFLEYHNRKEHPPKNSVVITFDDGYKDNYLYAYPILKKHNLPATIFLTTAAMNQKDLLWWDKVAYAINKTKIKNLELDGLGSYSLENKKKRIKALKHIQHRLKNVSEAKKNTLIKKLIKKSKVELPPKIKKTYLNWDEVNQMSKNNISFGAHTATHPILTNLPEKKAAQEIIKSKKAIEKNINKKVTLFCYPNGEQSDFNDEIIQILKNNGFRCAFTCLSRRNYINSDLFKLKRVFVRYEEDLVLFKNKLIGVDIILGTIYHTFNRIRRGIEMMSDANTI